MQFGALLVASSDRNLRDFERFSGLGQHARRAATDRPLQTQLQNRPPEVYFRADVF